MEGVGYTVLSKQSKIYIAGHRGLIGTAVTGKLQEAGYSNLIFREHSELDLTSQAAVYDFFHAERPEYVIMNAAVPANSVNVKKNPVKLMLDNTAMIQNVFSAALDTGVKKLLYACSVACYPSEALLSCETAGEGSLSEELLQPGRIEKVTERYYAMPKLLGEELCRAMNDHGIMKCVTLVIPHAYGICYHYEDPSRLPVYPALIKRFCDAAKNHTPEVVIWGSGKLLREFTYVDDIADGYRLLMEQDDAEGIYNIGAGQFVSIREAAETMKEVTGYQGEITFDLTKPEGIGFPLLNTEKLRALGWRPMTEFKDGVKKSCEYYERMFR